MGFFLRVTAAGSGHITCGPLELQDGLGSCRDQITLIIKHYYIRAVTSNTYYSLSSYSKVMWR